MAEYNRPVRMYIEWNAGKFHDQSIRALGHQFGGWLDVAWRARRDRDQTADPAGQQFGNPPANGAAH